MYPQNSLSNEVAAGDGLLIRPSSCMTTTGGPTSTLIRIPQDLPPLLSNGFSAESESEASTQTSSTVRSLCDLRRRSFEGQLAYQLPLHQQPTHHHSSGFSPLLVRTHSDDSMNSGHILAPKFRAHAPKNSEFALRHACLSTGMGVLIAAYPAASIPCLT